MTNSQNIKNEQQKDLCITSEQLTEEWKKGKLPEGIYYIEFIGGNSTIAYIYRVHTYKNKTVCKVKAFNGFITKNQMKSVLAEVPTYEEHQATENYVDYLKQCISVYEDKEKQYTKDSVAYMELADENAKLKILLGQCYHLLYEYGWKFEEKDKSKVMELLVNVSSAIDA